MSFACSLADDEASLMKPMETKKRPLASLLSIDNNNIDENDINSCSSSYCPPSPLPSSPPCKKQKQTLNTIIDPHEWILSVKNVPELPFLYLKEKTSVVVLNDDPNDIARRIVDCAKIMNAYGHYDCQKAKATLTINDLTMPSASISSSSPSSTNSPPTTTITSSSSFLKFTIQLFKVTDQKNKCIIVEIQKIHGSSIQFHQVASKLLHVAKDAKISIEHSKTTSNYKKYHLSTTAPAKRNKDKNNHVTTHQEEMFHCTLEIVDALLKKDRIDANLLGMESLQLLTNRHSSSQAMNHFVANVILTGSVSIGSSSSSSSNNHDDEKFHDIKDIVSSLITKYTTMEDHDGEESVETCTSSVGSDIEGGYYQKMRVCALTVLSNSIKTFFEEDSENNHEEGTTDATAATSNPTTTTNTPSNNNNDLESILSSDEWIGNHGLFNMLMNQLKHAKVYPHEAYLASTCLETLLRKSIQIRDYVCKERHEDVYSVVKDSLSFGQASYPLLGMLSSKILDMLGEEGKE